MGLLLLAACKSGGPPTSGFLGSYSGFKQRDDDTLVQELVKPQELARYRRVMVEKVFVYLDPDAGERQISPNDQRVLREMFTDVILDELDERFEVLRDPGDSAADVLLVRAAITNVRPGGLPTCRTAPPSSSTASTATKSARTPPRR